ncbi:DAZ associated protein 2, partial [Chelydra serpentina]
RVPEPEPNRTDPRAAMNSKGQYPTQPSYPVQPPGNPSVYPQTMPLPQ